MKCKLERIVQQDHMSFERSLLELSPFRMDSKVYLNTQVQHCYLALRVKNPQVMPTF